MAKKQRKKKKTSKRYELYDKTTRKNKFCPKCGPGTFLAKHKDRLVCGKCKYSEFSSTKEGAQPKEQPKTQDKPKETPKEEKKEQPKEKAEKKKE